MKPQQFKSIRKAKGWTQKQLGDYLGFSRTTIINYEVGRNPIPKVVCLAVSSIDESTQDKVTVLDVSNITDANYRNLRDDLLVGKVILDYHPRPEPPKENE